MGLIRLASFGGCQTEMWCCVGRVFANSTALDNYCVRHSSPEPLWEPWALPWYWCLHLPLSGPLSTSQGFGCCLVGSSSSPFSTSKMALCSHTLWVKRCRVMIAATLSHLIPATLDSNHPYEICPVVVALSDFWTILPAQHRQSPRAPLWTCWFPIAWRSPVRLPVFPDGPCGPDANATTPGSEPKAIYEALPASVS